MDDITTLYIKQEPKYIKEFVSIDVKNEPSFGQAYDPINSEFVVYIDDIEEEYIAPHDLKTEPDYVDINDAVTNIIDERPYECLICHKRCTTKDTIRVHINRHTTTEAKFACEICQKRFEYCGGLKVHMRLHTGEKPYNCDNCHKRYTQKKILTVHKSYTSVPIQSAYKRRIYAISAIKRLVVQILNDTSAYIKKKLFNVKFAQDCVEIGLI